MNWSDTPCIIWRGPPDSLGYGRCGREGKNCYAHRVALEDYIGRRLLSEEHACHHCDVRLCVNPLHLYVGDVQTNVADRVRRGRNKKTVPRERCKYGHELRDANLLPDGACRECRRRRGREAYHRRQDKTGSTN